MRASNSLLKWVMSATLFVLLLVVVGTKNALAQDQVATLQHNDSITGVFYGPNAYSSAYETAVDGDIITLSSGTFWPCNINKAITIHGAGCVYDSLTQVSPTIIAENPSVPNTNRFRIESDNTSFEGIWFTVPIITAWERWDGPQSNISFLKCNINALETGDHYISDYRMNFQFVNCIVNTFSFNKFYNTTIINSVIRFTEYNHFNNSYPTTIINSIVLFDNALDVNNIIANNSIVAVVSENNVSNCTFFNCIGIETGETSLFEGQIVQNVMEVDGFDDVFETFAGTVTYDNSYELKEEITTSFLGNDGTEVGIYGGMMPYDPRPTYMRMKRCNVAPRSTIDNKLSVEIEVLTDGE